MTLRAERRSKIRAMLDAQPRIRLAALPTPLEPLPRLTAALGGPTLFVKRDDLTGLAFGGNKTRQLEYVFGDVLRQNPDVLVTGANIQSNWSRQAAAAAARLGIPIILILRNTDMQEIQGNVLLDYWLGAEVRFVDEPDTANIFRHIANTVAELRAQGKRAVSLDAWSPATALGYVDMMLELDAQCEQSELSPSILWLSAAGSTQAGIILGARLLGWNLRVAGVAPFTWPDRTIPALVSDIANRAASLLGADARITTADVENFTTYIGPGYAVPSEDGLRAMRLAARTDALLLDPVYTAKAMAGLMDQVQKGSITRDDCIIFLHTGGLPAVFAYRETVERMSKTTL